MMNNNSNDRRQEFLDVFATDEFNKSMKRSDARKNRATRKAAQKISSKKGDPLQCKNWGENEWTEWLLMLLTEFDVPCSLITDNNKYRVRNSVRSFIQDSLEVVSTPEALLEATLNLIVGWNEEDFRFYQQRPTSFHLGYISKAWNSYRFLMKKEPALRLSVYSVSDAFSDRVRLWIPEGSDTTSWLRESSAPAGAPPKPKKAEQDDSDLFI